MIKGRLIKLLALLLALMIFVTAIPSPVVRAEEEEETQEAVSETRSGRDHGRRWLETHLQRS